MKIIAFSLYGSNPRYSIGAIKNVEIAANLLPEWRCRIYYDESVPKNYIETLKSFNNVDMIKWERSEIYGVFWRFYPFFESDSNICISRDTDSRITEREVRCLNEWLESDKSFHIIRDHERHYDWPIIATMIGVKGKLDDILLKNMEEANRSRPDYYTIDQVWLRDILWKMCNVNNCLIHGIKETKWMMETRNELKDPFMFIGNGFDENDNPLYHHLPHADINRN